MIRFKKKHPSFDLSMELLATLPYAPDHALQDDLVEDLGLEDKVHLYRIIQSLNETGKFEGWQVSAFEAKVPEHERLRGQGGISSERRRAVQVRAGQLKVQRACKRYLKCVYG